MVIDAFYSRSDGTFIVTEIIHQLLHLSHELGREERQLALLGEGSCAARMGLGHFAIKASGASLSALTESDLTVCDLHSVADVLNESSLVPHQLEARLLAARIDPRAKRPSIESIFHAVLLRIEGVNFIGHVHPLTCTSILCSPRAEEFARRRLFPDHVTCCGPESVYVPYTDPGLKLAYEIRDRTLVFMRMHQKLYPRLILLQNHGVIALGESPQAVIASLLMAEKAARIYTAATSLGGAQFLTDVQVRNLTRSNSRSAPAPQRTGSV